MNKQMETSCLSPMETQWLWNSALTHHMVSSDDQTCWSHIQSACDLHGGTLKAAGWNILNWNCSWAPRTGGCPIRDQETLHRGPEKVVFQTGTDFAVGGLSTSAFLTACVCSDTSLFKGHRSQDPGLAILEKNLESTLPDVASAATLTLWNLPWALGKVSDPHWAYGLGSAQKIESLGKPQTSPWLHTAQTQPLAHCFSSHTKY